MTHDPLTHGAEQPADWTETPDAETPPAVDRATGQPATFRPLDDDAKTGASLVLWADGSYHSGHWHAETGKFVHANPDPAARPTPMNPQPTHYHPRHTGGTHGR